MKFNSSQRNRNLVRTALDRWKVDDGDMLELLDEHAEWTIVGSRLPAGTYRGRQHYMTAAVEPLFAKLAARTVPKK